ncbi:MAG: GGDEF domain-containing protein [Gammaproteobacteria bacterium]|nr:GGDEF domain-containing protein [Gammaproteobacteria bacterium]
MPPGRFHPPLALAMALLAILPASIIAWALAAPHALPQVIGWLLLALGGGVAAALALAASVTRPLAELERRLRSFDPEADSSPPVPPPAAPREVAVLFDRLAAIGDQLQGTLHSLRASGRRGDLLRSELVAVIGARDRELKGRGEALQEAQLALERQTRSDALTGTANRRGFTEFLDRAWRTAQREQQALSILMIDIDHLQAYETLRGPEQADACIQAIANATRHLVGRATDLVAHHGDGRFIVLLGNTPLEGALRLAEQLRGAVQALALPHPGTAGPGVVTVSIGLTSTLPRRSSRSEPTLAAAERALQAAVEQGCNQVAWSTVARTGLFQALCLPNDPASRPC